MVLGLIVAVVLSMMGPERLRHPLIIATAVVGTIGALLVARHLMAPVNGAWRWIRGPVQVQPAELAKLALILVGAWYLVRVEEGSGTLARCSATVGRLRPDRPTGVHDQGSWLGRGDGWHLVGDAVLRRCQLDLHHHGRHRCGRAIGVVPGCVPDRLPS